MNILVAIEGSEFSEKALRWAIQYAKCSNGNITALTVVEDLNQFHEEAVPGMAEAIKEKYTELATDIVNNAKKSAQQFEMNINTVINFGSTASETILDYAKENNIDLIVVGSRGRTGLNRFVMGSVASRVVNHAKCSVTIVR